MRVHACVSVSVCELILKRYRPSEKKKKYRSIVFIPNDGTDPFSGGAALYYKGTH